MSHAPNAPDQKLSVILAGELDPKLTSKQLLEKYRSLEYSPGDWWDAKRGISYATYADALNYLIHQRGLTRRLWRD